MDSHYKSSVVVKLACDARRFLKYLDKRSIAVEAVEVADVDRFIEWELKAYKKKHGCPPKQLVKWRCGITPAVHGLLDLLRGGWPPATEVSQWLGDYVNHLSKQGLDALYVRDLCFHTRNFLDYLDQQGIAIETVDRTQVETYLSFASRRNCKKHWYWMEVHRRAIHKVLRHVQGEWPPGSTPSPLLLQFKEHLKQQRFSIHTMWRHVPAVRQYLDYLRDRQIEPERSRPGDLSGFLECRQERYRQEYGHVPEQLDRWRIRYTAPIRRFMRMIDPEWPPKEAPGNEIERFRRDICEGYVRWMREVRGLAKTTIVKDGNEARQFLAWLGERASAKILRSLGIEEIDRYIAWRMPGLRRATRVDVCICMRSFLRYLHAERWTGQDLSRLVSGPPVYAFSEIPRAFTEEQVKSLLAAARSDRRPSGSRDYAILMLLATYGLRAGEVLRLRLEDIDWRESKLHVRHSKTSIESTLPLVDPVGNALLKYLREARPETHFREVFLRVRAPYEPLRPGALHTVIGYRLKQAGIEVRGRRGAHAFRFARAASLLAASVPLKTIGDLLGHQSAESTGIYLRLPIDDLRAISLEVPGRPHDAMAR